MNHDRMKLFVHLKKFLRTADGGGRGLGGPPWIRHWWTWRTEKLCGAMSYLMASGASPRIPDSQMARTSSLLSLIRSSIKALFLTALQAFKDLNRKLDGPGFKSIVSNRNVTNDDNTERRTFDRNSEPPGGWPLYTVDKGMSMLNMSLSTSVTYLLT